MASSNPYTTSYFNIDKDYYSDYGPEPMKALNVSLGDVLLLHLTLSALFLDPEPKVRLSPLELTVLLCPPVWRGSVRCLIAPRTQNATVSRCNHVA